MTPKSMNYLNFSNKGSGFTGFMYTTPWYMKVKSKAGLKPRPTDSYMFLPPGPTWAEQITKGYNKLQEFKKIRSSETQELICVTNSLNQPSHLEMVSEVPPPTFQFRSCPENVVQWMSVGHFVQYEQGGNTQPDSYMHHVQDWGSKRGPRSSLSLQVSWVTVTKDPNHIPVTHTSEGCSKCSNNRNSWGFWTGRQVEGSSVQDLRHQMQLKSCQSFPFFQWGLPSAANRKRTRLAPGIAALEVLPLLYMDQRVDIPWNPAQKGDKEETNPFETPHYMLPREQEEH